MIPKEIIEKAIQIAVGNGWNAKDWYNNLANQIIDLPRIIKIKFELSTMIFYLLQTGLWQLLFINIPFAKALWIDFHYYHLQQLIILPSEKWWEYLGENLPK